MKILTFPCKLQAPTAVALGRFDGVHLAHKAVISAAAAHKGMLSPAVFTFCDSPNKGFAPLLTTQEEKAALIKDCGAEILINTAFDSIRNMSAEEFVKTVLCDCLQAKAVSCGYNYRFGKGACADVNTLKALCDRYGIALTCIEEKSGISSTHVRELLAEGNVTAAAELLGRNYSLSGNVVHGNAIGRTIETPTLNIAVPENKLLPVFGVYATLTKTDGITYRSVTNIGLKPTVGSDTPTVETYLLDAQGDFYGKQAEIELISFIRPEKKFSSLSDLKSAIDRDISSARETLK